MRYHRTLAEAKQQVKISPSASAQGYQQNYMPMFLPMAVTNEAKKGVMSIQTRQKFLDESIPSWVQFHSHRAFAIVLAIATIALIPVNIFLAAAAIAGAGWYYGDHVWKGFFINKLLKGRWLLEGT